MRERGEEERVREMGEEEQVRERGEEERVREGVGGGGRASEREGRKSE